MIKLASYGTGKFVYANAVLAASTLLGNVFVEGYCTSNFNLVNNKPSLALLCLLRRYYYDKVIIFYSVQKYIYTPPGSRGCVTT